MKINNMKPDQTKNYPSAAKGRKIYLAPLEDVSGYMFRNLLNRMFPGTDRFFTPFISAVEPGRNHKKREILDVAPDNNESIELVPQILTNNSRDFLYTAQWLIDKGYSEINLNLGCPSKDVVMREKGSGFLSRPDRLDSFFHEVFDGLRQSEGIRISVKTRIGSRDSNNIETLIEIFNRYPISEVTVHPRLGKDFYRGTPDIEAFRKFYEELHVPLVYNGDILTCDDIRKTWNNYPGIKAIMIGRGFLRNPAIAREYKGGDILTLQELREFAQRLYREYRANLTADKYALDKMKELWGWLKDNPLLDGKQRSIRAILKAKNNAEYESALIQVFR